MLDSQPLIAFSATRDGDRARSFYEGVLGLRLVSDDPFALVFDARGTMLRIQKVDDPRPHPFTSLGWQVDELEALMSALAVRGVTFERYPGLGQDEHGVWTAPGGAKIAWFKDPDGNTLSLSCFP